MMGWVRNLFRPPVPRERKGLTFVRPSLSSHPLRMTLQLQGSLVSLANTAFHHSPSAGLAHIYAVCLLLLK